MTLEPSPKQIQDFRSNFLKELESKGDATVSNEDVEKVKTSDDWLRRFLMHHDLSEKEALAMLWESLQWRKEFKTNEINHTNVNLDYIKEGVMFPHGRDKDGCTLFIFKCKKHVKGQLEFEELKRCVIYWLERLERQEKGKPVTIFFDMEGCGLASVDMELIKYVIHIFKMYYPYFLNYIIILEMAWILNAVFKVIKAMLPEKAVQKLKVIKKPELSQYVDPDQSLKCWGGNDNYTFVFELEENTIANNTSVLTNKKVHFADGSPMSETSSTNIDKEQGDGGILRVQPSSIITFVKEGNEFVSTLELYNTDNQINISYKMKTTSPEKFRVRPSAGCLAPGGHATITVTLLPGFHFGGLFKDKFLVMSMPVASIDLSAQELTELWKNPKNKEISQHRLRCAQSNEITRNGEALSTNTSDSDQNQMSQLLSKISNLSDCQSKLHNAIVRTQMLQYFLIVFVLFLSITVMIVLKNVIEDKTSSNVCYKSEYVESNTQ